MTITRSGITSTLARCLGLSFACWPGPVDPALGGPPDAPQVTRVVKLTHLAVILPESQMVRESWGGGRPPRMDLWTPSVQQVAGAEKAVLREIDGMEGGRAKPKVNYLIQYYGLSVNSRKWIVCGVWRLSALREKYEGNGDEWLADFLTGILTQSLRRYEDLGPNEPPGFLEFFYDPSTGALGATTPARSPPPPAR